MMNHNCRTSPECGVNSSYWAQLRPTKDNGMNRCNRCPLLQHRECVKACNQRPTTALSTGSCLKDNSCCKSFCKSPRPWTSSCHRLKKQIDQFHHNPKVEYIDNQPQIDLDKPLRNDVDREKKMADKCFHHSTFSELHCPVMTDDNRTLQSSTPTSQGTFIVSPRNRRIKKKKKKCHGNRKTDSNNLKTNDCIYNHQTKELPLETKSEINSIQILEPIFNVSRDKDEQFKETLQDKHLSPKIETKRRQNCKVNRKSCSKSSTPSPSSTPTVSMPRIEERKCCSFNDLQDLIRFDKERREARKTFPTCKERLRSAKINCEKDAKFYYTDCSKLSNYFAQNLSPPISKIHSEARIEILNSALNEGNSKLRTNSKIKTTHVNEKPFQVFNLNKSISGKNTSSCTPLPVHPVARPNLAAILRRKHCQRKLKEFENNCTYSEVQKFSSLDWEVRKTDAWKALLLSDSHKDILALRLATRQAEQALQRREYELNMELMRQRVKSSPLLLEGSVSTPCSISSSRHRIRHNCSSEGMVNCLRRQKRVKNCAPRSVSCSLSESNKATSASTATDIPQKSVESKPQCKDEETQTQILAERGEKSNNQIRKFRTICRIYTGHACEEVEKHRSERSSKARCCKCNHERPPTPIVGCHHMKSSKFNANTCRRKPVKTIRVRQKFPIENDSGDELCSLDRALL